MCGGPERLKANGDAVFVLNNDKSRFGKGDNIASPKHCSPLLELAANDDVKSFKKAVEEDGFAIDEISFWYGRFIGSKRMGCEERSPLMIASLFGSTSVLNFILSEYRMCGIDVNCQCGSENVTALHCAAAGGSVNAVEIVKLLLQSSADVNISDANGKRPADVIAVSPKSRTSKLILESVLNAKYAEGFAPSKPFSDILLHDQDLSSESSLEEGMNNLLSSPRMFKDTTKVSDLTKNCTEGSIKKEYPVDPTFPDINNAIYSTDDFRMYFFKVKQCSRAYSHDWTECPFVHPGENARRRDPRKHHYSCVPCPEFKKGSCRRGDACEYAHGVFESWLHPAQYRTRLCKDETSCTRKVCFFAHRPEELRPLCVLTGSAVSSPRVSNSLETNSVLSPLTLPSPSSVYMNASLSPNHKQGGMGTPALSPSSSPSLAHSIMSGAWSQPNVPALHLPGGILQQTSRLRASRNARDIAVEELSHDPEFEEQLLNEFAALSAQAKMNTTPTLNNGAGSSLLGSGKFRNIMGSPVSPVNLDDMFASEMMSPKHMSSSCGLSHIVSDETAPFKSVQGQSLFSSNQMQTSAASPNSQMNYLKQGMIGLQAPPRSSSPVQSPCYAARFGNISPFGADMDQRNSEVAPLSPRVMNSLDARLFEFAHKDKRSYSSRDLGASLDMSSVPEWGSPTGKADWGVQKAELNKLRKSNSLVVRSSQESPLPSMQSSENTNLVDDNDSRILGFSPDSMKNVQTESASKAVKNAWLRQMHFDQQMVA